MATKTVRTDVAIRALLRERGADKTVCPSEVARAMAAASGSKEWHSLMPRIRETAAKLAARGELVVTQKGNVVDAIGVHGSIRLAISPSRSDIYRDIDFRKEPERYRVGRGEEGVLTAEPYKSELLPLWRFKTPEIAKASASALWKAFGGYRRARDFVGMDMARKFLQMGFTRARRYANHRSGRKYDAARKTKRLEPNAVKAASAQIFYEMWQRAERDRVYSAWRARLRIAARARAKTSASPNASEPNGAEH